MLLRKVVIKHTSRALICLVLVVGIFFSSKFVTKAASVNHVSYQQTAQLQQALAKLQNLNSLMAKLRKTIEVRKKHALPAETVFYNNTQSLSLKRQQDLIDAGQKFEAEQLQILVDTPTGFWVVDSTDMQLVKSIAQDALQLHQMPVFVMYDLFVHRCDGGSSLGVGDYQVWARNFSDALGDAPAVVIIEPDALPLITCLPSDEQEVHYQLLNFVTELLQDNNPNARVYLDAGHGNWVTPEEMTERLVKAGVKNTAGFSLNVSNYGTIENNTQYAIELQNRLPKTYHAVIDTARNGNGPAEDNQWCNARGRALGVPTTTAKHWLIDAYIWIKPPGESDGTCGGGPNAGQWWPEYALELIENYYQSNK